MMSPAEVRILVADDHALFRSAVRNLLDREPDFQVVGEASTAHETVQQVTKLQPDVLLLDISMPQESGMEALRQLAAPSSEVKSILLTAAVETKMIVQALQLGARGVILKHMATELLFRSIRSVMAGQIWVGRECISEVVSALKAATPARDETNNSGGFGLTRREMEIISAVVDGLTNKDIAEKLSLSEQTVKHHLTNIFSKLGVPNRLELALLAINQRIVTPS